MEQPSHFIGGLDLGKLSDPTALAIVEKFDSRRPVYHVRYLHRYHLGTPYMVIAAESAELFGRPTLRGATLAVDQTGVGQPVVELLRALDMGVALVPITITGGFAATRIADGSWHVPKRDLATAVKLALESERLLIASSLPHCQLLRKELRNFQVKITKAANEIFEAREGEHDDLVLAVAMAIWVGETQFTGAWDPNPSPGAGDARTEAAKAPPGFWGGSAGDIGEDGQERKPRDAW